MNTDAYRTTWERYYRGDIGAGAPLFVALVMAELAEPASGTVTVGLRTLADLTGYGKATIREAIEVAGLYELDGRGIGRRPSRYVLASSHRPARPVDNPALNGRSVPVEGRNSVRGLGRSVPVASPNGPLASSHRPAQLEPKTLKPRISVQHFEDDPALTPPCDLPERVDALRAAMEAEPPPVAPLEFDEPPCLLDAVPADEVAERVAELRARMVGRRRHPAGGGQR